MKDSKKDIMNIEKLKQQTRARSSLPLEKNIGDNIIYSHDSLKIKPEGLIKRAKDEPLDS